jgi:hypothetical protein
MHRIIVRVATVAAALALIGPATALASKGGHSHSTKACPTHKHQGKHNGSGKGHKNGGSKGKKCGALTHSALDGTSGGPTTGSSDPGDNDNQADDNDQGDDTSTADDQGDDNDQVDDTSGDDDNQGDDDTQGDQ